MNFLKLSLSLLLISTVFSCQTPTPIPIPPKRVGFYVLGEGQFGKNNSTLALSIESSKTFTLDYYGVSNNNEKIGDTSTDMVVYGAKSYIIVNVSNKIIVSNIYTGKKMREIDLGKEGANDVAPRYVAYDNGKVYVSTWNAGVVVLDTVTLSITKKIALSGAFHEGLAIVDRKLYVANSGNKGDAFGGSGTTISVIDLLTETESATITVPANPYALAATKSGKLFLTTLGNYSTIDAQVHEINTTDKTYTSITGLTGSRISVSEKNIYSCHHSYITNRDYAIKYDFATKTLSDFIDTNKDGFTSIYGVTVDPINEDVYFFDESGLLVCYNKEGLKIHGIANSGIRPNRVVFLDR